MDPTILKVVIAIIGGVLPPIIWLTFWLREDSDKPEPKIEIIKTFIMGILMVPPVLIVQFIIASSLISIDDFSTGILNGSIVAFVALVLWALSEEFFKFVAAYRSGLSSPANDEPIDPMIYMITAALGFSAGENVLYLLTPILSGDFSTAILTGNLRFIGAVLVHVACSATIGLGMSRSFGKSRRFVATATFSSFILAVLLHSLFNLFIIYSDKLAYAGMALIWLVIIWLIVMFEKIKKIRVGNFK